jgi:hypothetical protein
VLFYGDPKHVEPSFLEELRSGAEVLDKIPFMNGGQEEVI